MKKEECTLGAIVHTQDGLSYRFEVLALPDEKSMVAVKAVGTDCYKEYDSYHLDDLFLFDQEKINRLGVEMQAKVDETTSAFEKAFTALRALRDVEYQDGIGRYDLMQAGLVSLKELERTIDYGGWSSSALWC